MAPQSPRVRICVARAHASSLSIPSGIGQGRITNNLATLVNELDGALSIPDAESLEMVYDVLDSEGLYLGASSALNVVAAYKLAQKLRPGRYLCLFHVRKILSIPTSQARRSPPFSATVPTDTRAGYSQRHGSRQRA